MILERNYLEAGFCGLRVRKTSKPNIRIPMTVAVSVTFNGPIGRLKLNSTMCSPADLLRCNFIMRGVQLTPGAHTVEFDFSLPSGPLKVTLAATVIGILLIGLLVFLTRKSQNPASK